MTGWKAWSRVAFTATFMLVFHLSALLVFAVGVSWTAIVVAFLAYLVTGLGVTLGYHRYFAHRSFETSRPVQFLLGLIGCAAFENGPITWSRDHIHHHKHSDQKPDLHSPIIRDFFYSHIGWIWDPNLPKVDVPLRRLEKYPELRLLDRFHWVVVALRFVGLYMLGAFLGSAYGTSGWQLVVWGGIIATLWTWHITWCVNSVVHLFGKRRFATTDNSRNNFLIAVLALGEGNHNNHHAYAHSARQGFYWWEPDLTWLVILALEKLRIIENVKRPGPEVYALAEELKKGRKELKSLRRQGLLTREAVTETLRAYQKALGEVVRQLRESLRKINEGVFDRSERTRLIEEAYNRFMTAAADVRRTTLALT